VNQVNPGVFFYWMQLSVSTAGPQAFTLNQSITSSNNNFDHFFEVAAGSNVFTSGCTAVGANITQVGASTMITFNAATPGTYIIGIKYAANSVKDFPAPSPNPIVAYQFTMPGVPGSTSGILLQPKP